MTLLVWDTCPNNTLGVSDVIKHGGHFPDILPFLFSSIIYVFAQNINGFILSSYSGNDGLIFQTASDNLNETDLYQSFKLLMKKICDVVS